ncbi:uncharacterized protein JCM15063_000137 [Sporobolomyces koalae]|uniref:uncharacterized protein n=1 Tax=Sporobolomyces koalae TaxID=500713 RepID=UPI00316D77E3
MIADIDKIDNKRKTIGKGATTEEADEERGGKDMEIEYWNEHDEAEQANASKAAAHIDQVGTVIEIGPFKAIGLINTLPAAILFLAKEKIYAATKKSVSRVAVAA